MNMTEMEHLAKMVLEMTPEEREKFLCIIYAHRPKWCVNCWTEHEPNCGSE